MQASKKAQPTIKKIPDDLAARLNSRDDFLKKRSSGLFIKFDDQEIKICDFVEPLDGKIVSVDYNKTQEPSDKIEFMCYEIDRETSERMNDEPKPWTVGSRVSRQLMGWFKRGETTLEIQRNGTIGDKGTTYLITAYRP
jgi:hypothetical protein